MEKREWTTMDKSTWGQGPWVGEPDKIQWQDEATGYPCLMVRNGSVTGSWCGYVGLPRLHPYYGLNYDSMKKADGDYIDVHGGLTFSGDCRESDESEWNDMIKHLPEMEAQAAIYPVGDASRWVKEWRPLLNDFSAWKEHRQATTICHIGGERVWWAGFDCAHHMDLSPGMNRFNEEFRVGHPEFGDYRREETYRDVNYVKAQVLQLAQQLREAEGKVSGWARWSLHVQAFVMDMYAPIRPAMEGWLRSYSLWKMHRWSVGMKRAERVKKLQAAFDGVCEKHQLGIVRRSIFKALVVIKGRWK